MDLLCAAYNLRKDKVGARDEIGGKNKLIKKEQNCRILHAEKLGGPLRIRN